MLGVTLFFIPLLGVRLVGLWRQLTHLTPLLGVKFDTLAYAGRHKITFLGPAGQHNAPLDDVTHAKIRWRVANSRLYEVFMLHWLVVFNPRKQSSIHR